MFFDDNKKPLLNFIGAKILIPKGFAHGLSVLSEYATVFYKCDTFYKPEAERGIHYDMLGLHTPMSDHKVSKHFVYFNVGSVAPKGYGSDMLSVQISKVVSFF